MIIQMKPETVNALITKYRRQKDRVGPRFVGILFNLGILAGTLRDPNFIFNNHKSAINHYCHEIAIKALLMVGGIKKLDMKALFNMLDLELDRARHKFPGSEKLLEALTEEVGEVARELIEETDDDKLANELIQVACVAVRIAEEVEIEVTL